MPFVDAAPAYCPGPERARGSGRVVSYDDPEYYAYLCRRSKVAVRWAPERGKALIAAADLRPGDEACVDTAFAYCPAPTGPIRLPRRPQQRPSAPRRRSSAESSAEAELLRLAVAAARAPRRHLRALCRERPPPVPRGAAARRAAARAFPAGARLAAALHLGRGARRSRRFAELLSGVRLNATELRDDPSPHCADPPRRGVALWPLLSAANHSCEPNARLSARPPVGAGGAPRCALVVRRPVAAGSELFICYCDEGGDLPERQAALWQTHRFRCRCGRCERELGALCLPPADWRHSLPTDVVRVGPSQHGGAGLFAARALEPQQVLLVEPPAAAARLRGPAAPCASRTMQQSLVFSCRRGARRHRGRRRQRGRAQCDQCLLELCSTAARGPRCPYGRPRCRARWCSDRCLRTGLPTHRWCCAGRLRWRLLLRHCVERGNEAYLTACRIAAGGSAEWQCLHAQRWWRTLRQNPADPRSEPEFHAAVAKQTAHTWRLLVRAVPPALLSVPSAAHFALLVGAVRLNAHDWHGGTAVFPVISAVNHSCTAPNARFSVIPELRCVLPGMALQLLQPVTEGTELLADYLDPAYRGRRAERHAALAGRYLFCCGCGGCCCTACCPLGSRAAADCSQ
eukprot:TRINITY_DN36482_c0_g1_i1.p1 TRINITY_DN36482_c0_g1~~TRINITY_DN36482_c0_g1_i1.p1  ORF type:complete len:660 (+),score=136.59 TRINITY_DN36482_c0_g1_i1:96-1982(+)